jgi:hypothetical protein
MALEVEMMVTINEDVRSLITEEAGGEGGGGDGVTRREEKLFTSFGVLRVLVCRIKFDYLELMKSVVF